MKKILTGISFLGILFLLACNNTGTKVEMANDLTDTSKTTAEPQPLQSEPTQLKNVTIDENYFNLRVAKNKRLSKDALGGLGLEGILSKEDLKDASLNIKIIDTLMINKKAKVLILSRETENEQWAWLMVYENNKFLTTKQVYYQDFVEYLSKTSTLIKANKVIITTETNEEENETKAVEKYLFTDRQTLELVK